MSSIALMNFELCERAQPYDVAGCPDGRTNDEKSSTVAV